MKAMQPYVDAKGGAISFDYNIAGLGQEGPFLPPINYGTADVKPKTIDDYDGPILTRGTPEYNETVFDVRAKLRERGLGQAQLINLFSFAPTVSHLSERLFAFVNDTDQSLATLARTPASADPQYQISVTGLQNARSRALDFANALKTPKMWFLMNLLSDAAMGEISTYGKPKVVIDNLYFDLNSKKPLETPLPMIYVGGATYREYSDANLARYDIVMDMRDFDKNVDTGIADLMSSLQAMQKSLASKGLGWAIPWWLIPEIIGSLIAIVAYVENMFKTDWDAKMEEFVYRSLVASGDITKAQAFKQKSPMGTGGFFEDIGSIVKWSLIGGLVLTGLIVFVPPLLGLGSGGKS